MMKMRWIAVATVAVAMAGCHKPTATAAKPEADTVSTTPTPNPAGEEARNGLPDVKRLALATVYFDLDKSTLRQDAKDALRTNAGLLQGNAEVTVRLEGHCDERGSTQYNLALGERRGNAVKEYLTTLGIGASRLEVVSYGEERPVETGHDEAAWSKNRRVELAVTAGSDKVGSSYSGSTTR